MNAEPIRQVIFVCRCEEREKLTTPVPTKAGMAISNQLLGFKLWFDSLYSLMNFAPGLRYEKTFIHITNHFNKSILRY